MKTPSFVSKFILVTRKSPLAILQAEIVKHLLEKQAQGVTVQLKPFVTQGDRMLVGPLYLLGGKGLFVKCLEDQLLAGTADLAVHSVKDLPVCLPSSLMLGATLAPESPYDLFVSTAYRHWKDLPSGAVVGTSSLRRKAQFLRLRPDVHVHSVRGNIATRLQKLQTGEFDALILAESGLSRLKILQDWNCVSFSPEEMLPAVGQGVLGIEVSENLCQEKIQYIQSLNNKHVFARVTAERAVSIGLGGGCGLAMGVYAVSEGEEIWLRAKVFSENGEVCLEQEGRAKHYEAESLGASLAQRLCQQGARDLLCVDPKYQKT